MLAISASGWLAASQHGRTPSRHAQFVAGDSLGDATADGNAVLPRFHQERVPLAAASPASPAPSGTAGAAGAAGAALPARPAASPDLSRSHSPARTRIASTPRKPGASRSPAAPSAGGRSSVPGPVPAGGQAPGAPGPQAPALGVDISTSKGALGGVLGTSLTVGVRVAPR